MVTNPLDSNQVFISTSQNPTKKHKKHWVRANLCPAEQHSWRHQKQNKNPELNAKQTERGSLVTFGDVLFDLNKAELKPAAQNNIGKLAEFLNENPTRQVLIEGFTDSTGAAAYNLRLSDLRAQSVKRALVKEGVDFNRISTVGFGKEYPIADNATPASRSMNRRVEVTISHDDKAVAPRR